MAHRTQQSQHEEWQLSLSDSPCSYIPTEIVDGITASFAEKDDNDGTEICPRAECPATFEDEDMGQGLCVEANDVAFETLEQNELSLKSNQVVLENVQFEYRVTAAPPPQAVPNRLIYDMKCGDEAQLPGVLARSEGDPSHEDHNVNLCYEQFGRAFNFFYEVFGRNSIDDKGGPLVGVVNFGKFYPNATWSINKANNQHVLVFGNGWQNDASNQTPAYTWSGMFGGFVGSLEVVVHEMMHGISHLHLNLETRDDPGALDEHLSDVFGIMAEQWHKKQRFDEADWLVGEDCLVPSKKGFALRSFSAPGTAYDFGREEDFPKFGGWIRDRQVGHLQDKSTLSEDRGGIHFNSGILNRGLSDKGNQLLRTQWVA
ncbi:hypothetical protein FDECE_9225 [Fusarium decemcellulare]|nr:hypothetical protein FDECE_9225 [Fusarium decemcellulare]